MRHLSSFFAVTRDVTLILLCYCRSCKAPDTRCMYFTPDLLAMQGLKCLRWLATLISTCSGVKITRGPWARYPQKGVGSLDSLTEGARLTLRKLKQTL